MTKMTSIEGIKMINMRGIKIEGRIIMINISESLLAEFRRMI